MPRTRDLTIFVDRQTETIALPLAHARGVTRAVVPAECNNCKKKKKTSRITAKIAWSAILTRAANKALLSKISNLIGRARFSGAAVRMVTRPSFLLIEGLWRARLCRTLRGRVGGDSKRNRVRTSSLHHKINQDFPICRVKR